MKRNGATPHYQLLGKILQMNHDEAIREQAVERYLLGELPEDMRTGFEEHFFDCAVCASDIKDGARFVDALRDTAETEGLPQRQIRLVARRSPVEWLRPWLGPALAASLLVLAYQNIMVLPGMRRAAARSKSPSIMSSLVLANIDARGADIPKVSVRAHRSFLISVDIPSKTGYSSYLCSLYSPSGQQLWQLPVSLQQAENTVPIRVPADKAAEGIDELRVSAVPSRGGPPAEVGRYRFNLQISQ